MLMHVHVKEAEVFGACIICALNGFPNCTGAHHGADAAVIDIILVSNGIIFGGENDQAAIIKMAGTADEKPDPFRRKRMGTIKIASHPIEKVPLSTEDNGHR
jgi:hypothetical protein